MIRNARSWLVNGEESAFWDRVERGDWEPLTYEILDRFLDGGHSYVDAGAWIGPTLLYAAHTARHCYAFEPDPVAFARLRENVSLNPSLQARITLSPLCLAPVCGPALLGNKTSPQGGDSMSSLLFAGSAVAWNVLGVTLERFMADHAIRDCTFLKMDIEGGEFDVLPAMAEFLAKHRPTIYLAFHPRFLPDPEPALRAIEPVLSLYRHLYTPALREVGPEVLYDPELRAACYDLVLTDRDV